MRPLVDTLAHRRPITVAHGSATVVAAAARAPITVVGTTAVTLPVAARPAVPVRRRWMGVP